MGVAIMIEMMRGRANLTSKTPRKKFINEAVMVDAELMKRPTAFARFIGISIIEKMGTKPMAEPTPPIEKSVESPSVKKKYMP